MNVLYWILALVVVFTIYVWLKRRQYRNNLPVFERQKEDQFAEACAEANKKSKEAAAKKEAERLKAAQKATTWEEAQKVVVGNYPHYPSAWLAIQKLNQFSLKEVLSATTIKDLVTANNRARTDSLAKKFVPFMYEYLSRREVECASSVDALIVAAERAPKEALDKNTALYVAFAKLHREFRHR